MAHKCLCLQDCHAVADHIISSHQSDGRAPSSVSFPNACIGCKSPTSALRFVCSKCAHCWRCRLIKRTRCAKSDGHCHHDIRVERTGGWRWGEADSYDNVCETCSRTVCSFSLPPTYVRDYVPRRRCGRCSRVLPMDRLSFVWSVCEVLGLLVRREAGIASARSPPHGCPPFHREASKQIFWSRVASWVRSQKKRSASSDFVVIFSRLLFAER